MKNSSIEQVITKTCVCSLAPLAVIGFFAAFLSMCGADFSVFYDTFIESVFLFIVLVLSLLVGFCFPASLLLNFSSIAASLKNRN